MSDKHTPGPWVIHDGPSYLGGGKDLCIGAGDEWIANMNHRVTAHAANGAHPHWERDRCDICSVVDDDEITGEQEANAHLIAAAPDLLEALKTVTQWGGGPKSENRCTCCDRIESEGCREGCAHAAARAAITKATGEKK